MIMKNKTIKFLSVGCLMLSLVSVNAKSKEETRDPYLWPFSQKSIWNMPIGKDAKYVPANLETPTKAVLTVDEDIIVLTPDAPLMEVYKSDARWDRAKDRCVKTGGLIGSYPIPKDFVVNRTTWDGVTPNAGIAILMPDKKTIVQGQPFAHCSEGDYATMAHLSEQPVDIHDDGYYGAHGGSRFSAIGGTLRTHELTPSSGPIRHAIKINLCGSKNLYWDAETKGYRWPAKAADSYAEEKYNKNRTTPVVKECRIGALMAIPAQLKIEDLQFETEPAKTLAAAFQDYGAYVVDDSGWDVFNIETEWSPTSRFRDVFKKNWGFDFVVWNTSTPWGRDIAKIYAALNIVDNNSATSIGGGGTPRKPLAPAFSK